MRLLLLCLLLVVGSLGEEKACPEVEGLKEALEVAQKNAKRNDVEIGGLEAAVKAAEEKVKSLEEKLSVAEAEKVASAEQMTRVRMDLEAKLAAQMKKSDEYFNKVKKTSDARLEEYVADRDRLRAQLEERGLSKGFGFEGGVFHVSLNVSGVYEGLKSGISDVSKASFQTIAPLKTTIYEKTGFLMLKATETYETARRHITPLTEKVSVKTKETFSLVSKKASDFFIKTEADAKQFLLAKNMSCLVNTYERSRDVSFEFYETKAKPFVSTASQEAEKLVRSAYAKAAPIMEDVISSTKAETSAFLEASKSKMSSWKTSMSIKLSQVPDLCKLAMLASRDKLVKNFHIDAKYANAIVAFVVTTLSVIFLMVAFATLRFLLFFAVFLFFKTVALANFLFKFLFLKTPLFCIRDLAPASFFLAIKLLVLFPLKILFAPFTLPLYLLNNKQPEPNKEKTTTTTTKPKPIVPPSKNSNNNKKNKGSKK